MATTVNFNGKKLLASIGKKGLRQVLSWAGREYKRAIKKSVNKTAKRTRKGHIVYVASKPGEPPKKRTGLMANAIMNWVDSQHLSVVVGPASAPGQPQGKQSTPHKLEHGGTVITFNFVERQRKVRNFRPDSVRDKNKNKYGEKRSDRPQYAKTTKAQRESGNDRYRYFYSRERWEAASENINFLAWARGRTIKVETSYKLYERPFIKPIVSKIKAGKLLKEKTAEYFRRELKKQKR